MFMTKHLDPLSNCLSDSPLPNALLKKGRLGLPTSGLTRGTSRFSRALTKKEVPSDDTLTSGLLRLIYCSEGKAESADRYWYFRPWKLRSPTTSDVYVRFQPNGYVGFAYFDATTKVWLWTASTAEKAWLTAEAYVAELSSVTRELRYASCHQNTLWSAVPLAGLIKINFDLTDSRSAEMEEELALLRWALDPQRKRRNAG
jgi:hypothetical protein